MGFFNRMLGNDQPWGDTNDAMRLLQHGKIDSGRELLRCLAKHEPTNLDALVLGAYEFLRTPENPPLSRERKEMIDRISPQSCESDALQVLATWTDPSDYTVDCFDRMSLKHPRGVQGTAAFMLAQLCMSDMATKGVLLGGKGQIDSALVTGVLKGSAQLIVRRAEEALETYRGSRSRAEGIPDLYEKDMDLTISPSGRVRLVATYRNLCSIGEGLTLRDLGRGSEASTVFAAVAQDYPSFAAELTTLAQER